MDINEIPVIANDANDVDKENEVNEPTNNNIKKRQFDKWDLFFARILKKCSNDKWILSEHVKDNISDIISVIIKNIVELSIVILDYNNKITITQNEIECSTNLILPDNLSDKVMTFAKQSVDLFSNQNNEKKLKSSKAGLIMPVSRITHLMKKYMGINAKYRLSATAPIYLTAIIDFLLIYLFNEMIVITKNLNRKTITSYIFMKTIVSNIELRQFVSNCKIYVCDVSG